MKLYLIVLIAFIGSYHLISAALTNRDKLIDAIKISDLRAVKKFLRRLGPLEEQEKKEFVACAENEILARQKGVSIFKSRSDAAKFIGGTLAGSLGLLAVYGGCQAFARNHSYIYLSSVASFFSLYGFYKAYRGLSCETAKERLQKAREVGKEVKNAELIMKG